MKASPKTKCYATFNSVHYVLQAEKILKEAGVAVDSIPVPREISSDCGICLSFPCQDRPLIEEVLKKHGQSCDKIVEHGAKTG